MNLHEALVADGGVYWRCKKCGLSGVIVARSELAIAVRKKMGIEPPEPCGLEYTEEEPCPMCTGEIPKETNNPETDESSAENS